MKICIPSGSPLLALLVCLLQTPAASAAMTQARCTATTEGELAFGPYTSIEIDALSTVSVTCPDGVPYALSLDNGLHYAAPHRRLQNGWHS
jgi:spore coat protein U-like protein